MTVVQSQVRNEFLTGSVAPAQESAKELALCNNMRRDPWTLVCWDIENVPVPHHLQNSIGVRQLRQLLEHEFAKSRRHQLYCIKFACHTAVKPGLLGLLTIVGDMEALVYERQGKQDKTQNADRLLKQAADRFMHMLEDPNGPEHLVVFITSDQDFSEKIQELQRRNFKVAVLHHKLCASAQPVGILNTADEAHDWLPFLEQHLGTAKLTKPAGKQVKKTKAKTPKPTVQQTAKGKIAKSKLQQSTKRKAPQSRLRQPTQDFPKECKKQNKKKKKKKSKKKK